MIRLTILYNLASGNDEEEFLKWWLGEYRETNLAIGGVVRADFGRIDGAWPEGTKAPYRFMSTLDWPDTESFKKGFYDPQVQADLDEDLKKVIDPVFLISEILDNQRKEIVEG
jgi:hypothetical protein